MNALPRPEIDPRLVSVIVPALDEAGTIAEVIARVWEQPFAKEVIVVDDGSRDETALAARAAAVGRPGVRIHQSPINLGKGTAVRIGYALARGGILAVQDADLELDPADLCRLVQMFDHPAVEAVYGSRFLQPGYTCKRRHRIANASLSLLTSALYGARVSDMETCYKLFRRDVIERLRLESTRFEFEPEVTAKVLRLGVKIHEAPISYQARSVAQGKKIGWRDGVEALGTLVRWRLAPMERLLRRPGERRDLGPIA